MDEGQMQIPLPEDFQAFYQRRLRELIEDFPFAACQGQRNPYALDEYIHNYRDYEIFLHARLLKEIYDTRGDVQSTSSYWQEQCRWLKRRLEDQTKQNQALVQMAEQMKSQLAKQPPQAPVVPPPPIKDNKGSAERLDRFVSVLRYGLAVLIAGSVAFGVSTVRSGGEIADLQHDLTETQTELADVTEQVDFLTAQVADYESAAELLDLQLVEAVSQYYAETGEILSGSKAIPALTVYVTPTGHKFHKEGCGYLTPSTQRAMTLSEAKDAGYTACSKCW